MVPHDDVDDDDKVVMMMMMLYVVDVFYPIRVMMTTAAHVPHDTRCHRIARCWRRCAATPRCYLLFAASARAHVCLPARHLITPYLTVQATCPGLP